MKSYRIVGRYRRTVSSIPSLKHLIGVQSLEDKREFFGLELGQLCPDVILHLLEGTDGSLYWSKKWLNERQRIGVATLFVESFLGTLGQENLYLSVDSDKEFGLIYPFNQELFASTQVVHQWDRRRFFDAEDCVEIERIAATLVITDDLPWRSLGELTDFQIVRTRAGLVFLECRVLRVPDSPQYK